MNITHKNNTIFLNKILQVDTICIYNNNNYYPKINFAYN